MKKIMSKAAVILILFSVLVLSFVSCGKKDTVVGEYEVLSWWGELDDNHDMTLNIKEDKTIEGTMYENGTFYATQRLGTWEQYGDVIVITTYNGALDFWLADGKNLIALDYPADDYPNMDAEAIAKQISSNYKLAFMNCGMYGGEVEVKNGRFEFADEEIDVFIKKDGTWQADGDDYGTYSVKDNIVFMTGVEGYGDESEVFTAYWYIYEGCFVAPEMVSRKK